MSIGFLLSPEAAAGSLNSGGYVFLHSHGPSVNVKEARQILGTYWLCPRLAIVAGV